MNLTTNQHRSLIASILDVFRKPFLPRLKDVFVTLDGETVEIIREGKWVNGRFKKNIRIDQPTHLAGKGMVGGHIYDRKGREKIAVKIDGTASHGRGGVLSDEDADALRRHGFAIPSSNIVEWTELEESPELLFG